MEQVSAEFATYLPFGEGLIGRRNQLSGEAEMSTFANNLAHHTLQLTHRNTAGCVDERETLSYADGTNDPDVIAARVESQLAGGIVLATTKALVAANAKIVQDATNFTDAYMMTNKVLGTLGYEDGGHKGCGASKLVEASVARKLSFESLLLTVPALTSVDEYSRGHLQKNALTMQARLEAGFYGSWSASWHEGFLADTVPQNFAILKEDTEDHETHGHNGSGLYIVRQAGMGFAKNAFIAATGQEAFADTPALADELANKLGVDDEERTRIRLGYAEDAPDVLNQLVTKNFPAFVQVAA